MNRRSRKTYSSSKKSLSVSDVKKIAKKAVLDHDADNYYDNYDANLGVSSSGSIRALSNIATSAGTSVTSYRERRKDEITAKSLTVRGHMVVASNVLTDDAYDCLRLIIFAWKGKGTPLVTNILDTRNLASTNYVHASYVTENGNPNFLNNYQIYYDKCYTLGWTGGSTDRQMPVQFKFIKKFKTGHDIAYTGNGAADYSDGALFFLLISNSTAVPNPRVWWASRLRYST